MYEGRNSPWHAIHSLDDGIGACVSTNYPPVVVVYPMPFVLDRVG